MGMEMHRDSDLESLFQAIVENDTEKLRECLVACRNNTQTASATMRGFTPLTLAAALNRADCINLLLEEGGEVVSTVQKDIHGWNALQEATSFGSRETIAVLLISMRKQLGVWFESQGKLLLKTLAEDLSDFTLDLKWEFASNWVPFIAQICPSDTCRIQKKGTSVRIDSTLVGFENLSWIRGNISIIFTETANGPRLVLCDHERRVVQQVYPQDFTLTKEDLEEEINIVLNSPIVNVPEFDFSQVQIAPQQQGILFKTDRQEMVGPYNARVYNIANLKYTQKTRMEHLKVNPIPQYLASQPPALEPVPSGGLRIVNSDFGWADEDGSDGNGNLPLAAQTDALSLWGTSSLPMIGNSSYNSKLQAKLTEVADNDESKAMDKLKVFRGSLDPPPNAATSFSWNEFRDVSSRLHIGRLREEKEETRNFQATVWMYDPRSQGDGWNTSITKHQRQDSVANSNSLVGWVVQKAWDVAGSTSSSLLAMSHTPSDAAYDKSTFPIRLSTLLPLLDLLGMRQEHVRSLKDFLAVAKLPPGFPVKMEVPIGVVPLNAVVTFENIQSGDECSFDPNIFVVPGKKMGYVKGEVVFGRQ